MVDKSMNLLISVGLAPIVLFTYKRLDHTKQTIEALQNNLYAKESILYVFSDAPKDEDAKGQVEAVRDYLRGVDGFKEVIIICREKNWGLARNIIDGVTKIINQHGKIIVLEDDIVTSKYFLKYMNDALNLYEKKKKVMEISGYTYPFASDGLPESFFLRLGFCWGWATWKDRWQHFRRNPRKVINFYDTEKKIKKFNYNGFFNMWQQIVLNDVGSIHTWFVFWHATIVKMKGCVLYPRYSLVKNIGLDNTGENCGGIDLYKREFVDHVVTSFPRKIRESTQGKVRTQRFFSSLPVLSKSLAEFCRRFTHVFCYGAGGYGYNVKLFLEMQKVKMDGFIVSYYDSPVRVYLGKPVYELNNLPYEHKKCGIILSIKDAYKDDVKSMLTGKGISDFYEMNDKDYLDISYYLGNNFETCQKRLKDKITQILPEISYKPLKKIFYEEYIRKILKNFSKIEIRFISFEKYHEAETEIKILRNLFYRRKKDKVFYLLCPQSDGNPFYNNLSIPESVLIYSENIEVITRESLPLWKYCLTHYSDSIRFGNREK